MFVDGHGDRVNVGAQGVHFGGEAVEAAGKEHEAYGERAELAAVSGLLFADRLHVGTDSLQDWYGNIVLLSHRMIVSENG